MDKNRKTLIYETKQFALFKEIMDRNCWMLAFNKDLVDPDKSSQIKGIKYKAVDCKFFYGIFQNLKRQKLLQKVKHQN